MVTTSTPFLPMGAMAELDEAALAVHADSESRYWKAASGIAEMRHIH